MSREVHAADLCKPPTAITAASLLLVLKGASRLETTSGKFLALAGRAGDLVDGYVARKYDMSSDAGAIADVVADKLGMLAITAKSWEKDLVPKPILAGMAVKHSVNAAATIYNGLADEQKRSIRPPKSGKLSMFADNLSLGAFVFSDELDPASPAYHVTRGIGYAAATAGLLFGLHATRHYVKGEFDTDPALE